MKNQKYWPRDLLLGVGRNRYTAGVADSPILTVADFRLLRGPEKCYSTFRFLLRYHWLADLHGR